MKADNTAISRLRAHTWDGLQPPGSWISLSKSLIKAPLPLFLLQTHGTRPTGSWNLLSPFYPGKWHSFTVCRNWVIVNCAEKLLIFALGLDSKTLSDRPAVLNLDRNGHMTIPEAYANLWRTQLRSPMWLIVRSQHSCDSLFIRREHVAVSALWLRQCQFSNWGWHQLLDFHHFPSESVHHSHFICLTKAPGEFQNRFWQLLFLTSRLCPGYLGEPDNLMFLFIIRDGSGQSASEPLAPSKEVRPPCPIH